MLAKELQFLILSARRRSRFVQTQKSNGGKSERVSRVTQGPPLSVLGFFCRKKKKKKSIDPNQLTYIVPRHYQAKREPANMQPGLHVRTSYECRAGGCRVLFRSLSQPFNSTFPYIFGSLKLSRRSCFVRASQRWIYFYGYGVWSVVEEVMQRE